MKSVAMGQALPCEAQRRNVVGAMWLQVKMASGREDKDWFADAEGSLGA